MPKDQTSVAKIAMPGAGDTSLDLSRRNTGMSFQRTRMSADRTLMSVIRTSLSLISFGFTIIQLFQRLKESNVLAGGQRAPRNFGLALILLGVGMLTVGLIYHLAFMRELRHRRDEMREEGLIFAQSGFPVSLTAIVALLLLVVGLLAIASVVYRLGPFI
jgi:inner membrane protein YidH